MLLAMGCKRIVIDPHYLESLQRPNVDLEWDPIAEITESGITTKSGTAPLIGFIGYRANKPPEHRQDVRIRYYLLCDWFRY